jgi:hypothetical protein
VASALRLDNSRCPHWAQRKTSHQDSATSGLFRQQPWAKHDTVGKPRGEDRIRPWQKAPIQALPLNATGHDGRCSASALLEGEPPRQKTARRAAGSQPQQRVKSSLTLEFQTQPIAGKDLRQNACFWFVVPGRQVYHLPDNLMIVGAVQSGGYPFFLPTDGKARGLDALNVFETCVEAAATYFAKQR